MTAIRKLSNGRVYIDGVDAQGTASEVELPEIEMQVVEYEGLGLIGTPELPAGIEAMEATITWLHCPPEFSQAMFGVARTTNIQVVADQATYNQQTGTPVPGTYKCDLRVRPKTIGLGTVARGGDSFENENTFAVDYVKLQVNGTTLLEVDAYASDGIRVNGQLQQLL